MAALIETRNLCRSFAERQIVRNISFSLEPGEVLGFLGPNGAGKSTTMRMLCGALGADSGEILIDGIDLRRRPVAAKLRLGYLPETPPLYPELTVDEYLHFCARLHGLDRAASRQALPRAKARCGLTDSGQRLLGNLSKGYRQRVGIAQAIIHDPAVVILDEPTSGLDPNQIREIRQLIRALGEERGVLLSTHILPEVQAVCDRVMILHQGQLVHHARSGRRMTSREITIQLQRPPATDALLQLPGVSHAQPVSRDRFQLQLDESADQGRLAATLVQQGWGLLALIPIDDDLEQTFARVTGGEEMG